eukprot:10556582-Heterocapsa_arctica.AAC.2
MGPQPCSQRSIGITTVSRRLSTRCQHGKSKAEGYRPERAGFSAMATSPETATAVKSLAANVASL